jgi:hypothetical protein
VATARIEFAERLVEPWSSGEFDSWLDEVGSDIEFSPDPSLPDAGTYRGDGFSSSSSTRTMRPGAPTDGGVL